jgi:hypothetical protein
MKKAFTDNLDLQWMSLFWVTAVEVPRAFPGDSDV